MVNPIINHFGNKYWVDDSFLYHRIDGPAVIMINGKTQWYNHGCEITDKISKWCCKQGLDPNLPFTSNEQILFKLTFG